MPLKLTITNREAADAAPESRSFSENVTTVGRSDSNDLCLDDASGRVSSRHARLEVHGNDIYIVDLGSTNGTFLAGERLEPETRVALSPEAEVEIGVWTLRCEIEAPSGIPEEVLSAAVEEGGRALLRAGSEAEGAAALDATLDKVGASGRLRLLAGIAALLHEDEASTPWMHALVTQRLGEAARLGDAALGTFSALSSRFVGDGDFEDPEQLERFRRLIEQSVSQLIDWIASCLSGRKEFENRIGADVTRLFSLDGNPIKHGGGPAEIGRFLLNWDGPLSDEKVGGYLAEALRDLTAHQMAVLAGVQKAMTSALQSLDPAGMEEAAQGAQAGWLPAFIKQRRAAAAAWHEFRRRYADMTDNPSRLFNEFIYPNMRGGYLQAHDDQGIGGVEIEANAGS